MAMSVDELFFGTNSILCVLFVFQCHVHGIHKHNVTGMIVFGYYMCLIGVRQCPHLLFVCVGVLML